LFVGLVSEAAKVEYIINTTTECAGKTKMNGEQNKRLFLSQRQALLED
jgi:hypothetical protein